MAKDACLLIHGHFYQPPRENPWIEEIEIQESAAPYHDWNERIHTECYWPNARARVLDEKGKIVDIVNNYERMNFNFGPTLLSWLEEKHPETYRYILEADRLSQAAHKGHGNAMAQVYNHMIMPLATRRDQVTQVRWGVYDFKFRFGHDPESIWLPETAVNEETLEVLIEEGMKFIILSPDQAEAVRPLDRKDWKDVSGGTIDTKVPYRCFLKDDPSKWMDVFFYDGPIAREVSFGDLAFDAKLYADRIERVKAQRDGTQLIHVATDGETYGHHKGFGERALAYLLFAEASKRGFRIVNYAEFLEEYPPRFAVRLKGGEDGEGTSWSCAHGVKRWKDNCGCRVGGPAEWTQQWRKPLRDGVDWLSERLAEIFETLGSQYLKDVWKARNEYISLILDRSEKNLWAYFERHAKRVLKEEEVVVCLKLLEIQRHALLTQTSCGWFFDEVSGIETVQVLQYAARAIELAEEMTESMRKSAPHLYPLPALRGEGGRGVEEEFLRRLQEAKSNIPRFKDGRGVYEQLVKPRLASLRHVVSYYAITSLLDGDGPDRVRPGILGTGTYSIEVLYGRKESFGGLGFGFGHVHVRSTVTREESDLIFLVLQMGLYDFRCSIKAFKDEAELEEIEQELFDGLHTLDVVELLRKIGGYFGETYYALKDLLLAHRVEIISILTKETVAKIGAVYEHLYDENRKMVEIYRANHLRIPEEIRYAAQHTLKRQLRREVTLLSREGFNPRKAAPVSRLIEAAKTFGVELRDQEVSAYLANELEKRTKNLLTEVKPEAVLECVYIQRLAKKIGLELKAVFSQDHLFELLRVWQNQPETVSQIPAKTLSYIFDLARINQISLRAFKREIQKYAPIPNEEE